MKSTIDTTAKDCEEVSQLLPKIKDEILAEVGSAIEKQHRFNAGVAKYITKQFNALSKVEPVDYEKINGYINEASDNLKGDLKKTQMMPKDFEASIRVAVARVLENSGLRFMPLTDTSDDTDLSEDNQVVDSTYEKTHQVVVDNKKSVPDKKPNESEMETTQDCDPPEIETKKTLPSPNDDISVRIEGKDLNEIDDIVEDINKNHKE